MKKLTSIADPQSHCGFCQYFAQAVEAFKKLEVEHGMPDAGMECVVLPTIQRKATLDAYTHAALLCGRAARLPPHSCKRACCQRQAGPGLALMERLSGERNVIEVRPAGTECSSQSAASGEAGKGVTLPLHGWSIDSNKHIFTEMS